MKSGFFTTSAFDFHPLAQKENGLWASSSSPLLPTSTVELTWPETKRGFWVFNWRLEDGSLGWDRKSGVGGEGRAKIGISHGLEREFFSGWRKEGGKKGEKERGLGDLLFPLPVFQVYFSTGGCVGSLVSFFLRLFS